MTSLKHLAARPIDRVDRIATDLEDDLDRQHDYGHANDKVRLLATALGLFATWSRHGVGTGAPPFVMDAALRGANEHIASRRRQGAADDPTERRWSYQDVFLDGDTREMFEDRAHDLNAKHASRADTLVYAMSLGGAIARLALQATDVAESVVDKAFDVARKVIDEDVAFEPVTFGQTQRRPASAPGGARPRRLERFDANTLETTRAAPGRTKPEAIDALMPIVYGGIGWLPDAEGLPGGGRWIAEVIHHEKDGCKVPGSALFSIRHENMDPRYKPMNGIVCGSANDASWAMEAARTLCTATDRRTESLLMHQGIMGMPTLAPQAPFAITWRNKFVERIYGMRRGCLNAHATALAWAIIDDCQG